MLNADQGWLYRTLDLLFLYEIIESNIDGNDRSFVYSCLPEIWPSLWMKCPFLQIKWWSFYNFLTVSIFLLRLKFSLINSESWWISFGLPVLYITNPCSHPYFFSCRNEISALIIGYFKYFIGKISIHFGKVKFTCMSNPSYCFLNISLFFFI